MSSPRLTPPRPCRRALYGNIVLSGGSTMFKDFYRRLERDVKTITDKRIERNMKRIGRVAGEGKKKPSMNVEVVHHPMQRFAVWFGGSLIASQQQFFAHCHTKAEYDDEGPRICRHNAAFAGL